MILRKLEWVLLYKLFCSIIIVESQTERSYDTNDWIPITPTPIASGEEAKTPQKAIGRVLNLDSPNPKFFPENEYNYRKRRPHVNQYLKENSFKANDRHKHHKNSDRYKYEVPLQVQQSAPEVQYYTNQDLQLPTYQQPPPLTQGTFLEKPVLTRQRAPPINAPNLYEQYNLPFNSSFYQSLNPEGINQELQGNVRYSNVGPAPPTVNDDKQSVQLLYVPFENLKSHQVPTQVPQDTETVFHQVDPPRQETQIFTQNKQHLIDDIEQDLIQQTVQAHRLQQQIHLGRPVVVQTSTSTTTTPKPTKRKPHQPPLSVYLENNSAEVDDVLEALKDAKTIAVQDNVSPNSPQVFIGPSTMTLPSGYTRFPLPYINKLDVNRIERKIENLPFFVAPLSYKAPEGYSKIPLPSPHVGSVVVSNKEDSYKRSAPKPTPTYQNQITDHASTKPLYSSLPVGNANSQIFDPSHHSYYSTNSFLNPNSDTQQPYYLQFNVNDNINQLTDPSKSTQGQIQQPLLTADNVPPSSQSNTANVPIDSYKSPQPSTAYNQASNLNTQTPTKHIVPVRNSNPYGNSFGVTDQNENAHKYSFNPDQDIKSYQIPTRSSPSGNTNRETISSYQIPIKTSSDIPQYSKLVNEKTEGYSHTFSNENPSTLNFPSKIQQRSRHPTTVDNLHNTNLAYNTSPPSRSTSLHFNEPSSYLSSSFDDTREISITPKITISPKPSTEDSHKYSFDEGQKKQSPLDLAINQYELHQINSQLVEDNTEKEVRSPFDFSSHYNHDNSKPKDYTDYSAQFQVEKSKVKGKYDYSSLFDVDVDKPKFDYSAEFERYSSTPASILRDTYEQASTTPRVSPKSRRRSRPTARTTTTKYTPPKESYTVLEEFSAKPVDAHNITEPPKAVKYESEYKLPTQSEGADVSTNVHRLRTTTPYFEQIKTDPAIPQYDNIKTVIENVPSKVYTPIVNQDAPVYKSPTNQQDLNQNFPENAYRIKTTTPHFEHIQTDHAISQYDNIKTVIEDIPSKVYNLNTNQDTTVYTNSPNQHGLNQNLMNTPTLENNYRNNEEVSHPPTYVQSPLTEVSYLPKYNRDPVIEPLVQNRGQKQQDRPYNFEEKKPDIPDYTSSLQDQSVRSLLVPNLLVPTTENHQSSPYKERQQEELTATTTTTTTTTEKPSTIHTTRARGRQRGSSRFSSNSGTTSTSVPRRAVNRRRPVHTSRITTERSNTQHSSGEDNQKVTTRQRFRTRGRPSHTAATERISSTENEVRSYKDPTSETPLEVQTNPTSPQSYIKMEHTIEDQKLIIQSADIPGTAYPQYYQPQLQGTVTENPRLVLQYDNTATTQNPVMDIQITHPVHKIRKPPVAATKNSEEAEIHLQAGGVLHNNNNNGNESPSRQTSRVRGRARTRPRVATTTTEKHIIRTTGRPAIRVAPKRTTTVATTTTTTEKPSYKSMAEEEFFGFIRQPNFNQIYNIPLASATQLPVQIYENNQNQPDNTDVRVSTYQVFGSSNKNPNVRVQSYHIPQNVPQNQQQLDNIRLDFNSEPSDPTTVRFVGEIRPKYRPTTQNYEEIGTEIAESIRIETETPQPRVRGRVRIPSRKSNSRQSENEVSTSRAQQATRRSNVVRSRGRGSAQYKPPANLRPKEEQDADVEGGNYPQSYFQNKQATTNVPSFQISIDPGNEYGEGDQLTNPSLYQPKILPKPDEWTEATDNSASDEEYSPANEISNNIRLEKETVSPDESETTELNTEESLNKQPQRNNGNDEQVINQPIALPVTASPEQTTQSSDETFRINTEAVEKIFEEVNNTEKPRKGKGKRRGVWKLVRQGPVDPYEAAESQSYYTVVNSFGNIVKVKDRKNSYENEKYEDLKLGQHQLYNNYNPVLEQNSDSYDYESQKLPATSKPEAQVTKYYEVHDLNAETENTVLESTTVQYDQATINSTESAPTTTSKENSIFDSIYDMLGISDKEDIKEATTISSVTTEIETTPAPTTTTVISPTFPEEITEAPTTTPPAPVEPISGNSTNAFEENTEKTDSTSQKTQITRTFEVEPWEMRAIRTSTSTEVSHETEICYKGRCVKSTDRTRL